VRKPEEAFEMPLDYNAAPNAAAAGLVGPIDRNAVVAAVERYLASRGIAVAASGGSSTAAGSCGCSPSAPAASVVSNVAATVVDKFLAARGKGGFS